MVFVVDPDGDRKSTEVHWPEGVRIPAIGEAITVGGSYMQRIRDVRWSIDDPEHNAMSLPRTVVQLLI